MAHKSDHECIARLCAVGVSRDDATALRSISMTLHRWHELECGTGDGGIERDEAWAIERAAWPAKDRNRWWDGSRWNVKTARRTYSDEEKAAFVWHANGLRMEAEGFPAGGAWRETGRKVWWYDSAEGKRTHTMLDRETSALKRLTAIMARYPSLHPYVQGDPRGAALYVLRPDDVPAGADPSAYYSRGIAVYK